MTRNASTFGTGLSVNGCGKPAGSETEAASAGNEFRLTVSPPFHRCRQ
jgi:hypothetical protein